MRNIFCRPVTELQKTIQKLKGAHVHVSFQMFGGKTGHTSCFNPMLLK